MRVGRVRPRQAWPALGIAALAVVLCAPTAEAVSVPEERCRVTDKRIGELSGLAADGQRWYVINDGGTSINIFVLGKNCQVERVITNRTDPYDVEDMALAPDGTFWLADIGDNKGARQTVALHKVTRDGRSVLYRLSYPDGAHDAEALLLDRNGVPYVVTKTPLGAAGVYRPTGQLTSPGPTALTKVAEVMLSSTDTPGGPQGVPQVISSVLVTGGAVSADGTVIALRTYTDAYLYPAPDGDVVAALGRKPVRVPLPNEPQGEAIAFDRDGTLLSGSEGVGQPIRAIPDATGLVASAATPSSRAPEPGTDGGGAPPANAAGNDPGGTSGGLPTVPAVGVAIAAAAVLAVLLGRRRRRG